MKEYDVVIVGTGIYGLYIANLNHFANKNILMLDCDSRPFSRASYINQARLHNGYHYPRSLCTAKDTSKFFQRFNEEFAYAVYKDFKSIYAIAQGDSLTNADEFEYFCEQAGIPYKEIDANKYFKKGMVQKAYLTQEYIFDSNKIKNKLLEDSKEKNITIKYKTYINEVSKCNNKYKLILNNDDVIITPIVINTTYAGINMLNKLFAAETLNLKYELCEVELGKAKSKLKDYAFTIMDGNYFSTMPFGDGNIHSLTSVHFTPHITSYDETPKFDCQKKHKICGKKIICNCNECPYRPKSKNKQMLELFNKYMLEDYQFEFQESLFAIKPILMASEADDSRPTIIQKHSCNPTYISCLSGKVSTIYLMEDFIKDALKEEEK